MRRVVKNIKAKGSAKKTLVRFVSYCKIPFAAIASCLKHEKSCQECIEIQKNEEKEN